MCALALAACTDTLDEAAVPKPLSVAVNARDITARAPIHGTALPDASNIGISLVAEDGTPYDGVTYDNLKYTAAGTAPDQSWSTPNVPTLSSSTAKLVAYYPWTENTDYSAVPVETDTQTDYMYSQWLTGLSNANPNANIVMKHALTAVRVALVKGDFTADVDVSSVSVKSPAFATAGAMDATTGALTELTGIGDAVTVAADFPLTAQATNVEVMAVPDVSVSSGVTTVTTQIGDRKYSVNINFTESYKQGYIYTYTLTLNNTGMEVTSVAVTPWEEGTQDAGDLEVDNGYIVSVDIPENDYMYVHNVQLFTGTIDWGDGTTEVVDNETCAEHIYSSAGEYIISCYGIFNQNSSGNAKINSKIYVYKNNTKISCTKRINKIIHIGGEMGLNDMSDSFNGQELITKLSPGLFDGLEEVEYWCFAFEDTNISQIPAGIFDKCTKVKRYGYTFRNCPITEIPAGLFDYSPLVESFMYCFSGTNITEIPAGLFDNNPLVDRFSCTFAGCTGLTSIPEGLFDNNTKVTTFASTFDGCSNLTGESPYTTINVDGNDVKVHLYERSLYPEHFTAPTSYKKCFMGDTGLTDYADIPADWK